ncbi:MAG TPA: hypothetical protein VI756_29170 [Blastocatellia bacterium]
MPTAEAMHCGRCGTIAPFIAKKGMRFLTVFFIIPVLPLSGVNHMVECPNCRARYRSSVQPQAV